MLNICECILDNRESCALPGLFECWKLNGALPKFDDTKATPYGNYTIAWAQSELRAETCHSNTYYQRLYGAKAPGVLLCDMSVASELRTVVSGQLNVSYGLRQTNKIVGSKQSRYLIGSKEIPWRPLFDQGVLCYFNWRITIASFWVLVYS